MRSKLLLLAVLISCIFIIYGCTLAGGLIGSKMDNDQVYSKSNYEILELDTGTQLEIKTTVGLPISGKFTGFEPIEDSIYSVMFNGYLSHISTADFQFVLNEKYKINQRKYFNAVTGFNFGTIIFDTLKLGSLNALPISHIQNLTSQSNKKLTRSDLIKMFETTPLPLVFNMKINEGGVNQTIKTSNILSIKKKSGYGWIYGSLLGLIVDIIIINIYLEKNLQVFGESSFKIK